MHTYDFHGTTVTRVVEQCGPGFPPSFLYPQWDPKVLEEHRALMIPDCFDEALQKFIASIHTWVIKTKHHTILIDSCAGNHKERPSLPRFHQMNLPFLERLAEAGVSPESVDFVMCTHLHVDHCGWNTQLSNGRWVPTFPNAKYIFSKAEYEYWRDLEGDRGVNANVYEDSVLPVVQANLAQLVDGDHELGDDLRIRPTPGHTIGHIAFELARNGEHGVFCGDVMHQPLQVFRPDWNSAFCDYPDLARVSRRKLLEDAAERQSTVFTSHFASTSAGKVVRRGEMFDWQFV